MNTSSPFKQRPRAAGWMVGMNLSVWILELQGEVVTFRNFPGTIKQLMSDGRYYGEFGDNEETERYFMEHEVGQFIPYLDDESGHSHASVMLKSDHKYSREDILTCLKSALTGAWNAYKRRAEEAANDAIIAIDSFEVE